MILGAKLVCPPVILYRNRLKVTLGHFGSGRFGTRRGAKMLGEWRPYGIVGPIERRANRRRAGKRHVI